MLPTLLILLAYLLGSVSGSLLLGRLRGVDIRRLGSGNAGGTNAFRTQGARFALGVVLIDFGKGALAAALALMLPGWQLPQGLLETQLACVLAATLGHVYPVFHGFRGGKGAGTLVGGLLVVAPWTVPVLFAVWLAVLIATGYVGLATVCGAAVLAPTLYLFGAPWPLLVFGGIGTVLLVYTHRSNLARLRAGNENRFERVRLFARRTPRA